MKKYGKRILAVLMAMALMAVSLCGTVTAQEDGAYVEILDGEDVVVFEVTQSISTWDFMVYPYDNGDPATWTTEDESVLRIDEEAGIITAIAPGETTLTATVAPGLSDTVTVKVKEPAVWSGVGTTPLILKEYGDRKVFSFTPTVTGSYTLYSEGEGDPYIEVYDSNLNVIDMADDMNEYNFVLQCEFTAGESYVFVVGAFGSAITEITLKQGIDTEFTAFDFKQDSVVLSVGDIYVPEVAYEPLTVPYYGCDMMSGDDSVIALQEGGFVAQGVGTTTLTAISDNGLTATMTVTVQEPVFLLPNGTVDVHFEEGVAVRTFAILVEETGVYTIQSLDVPIAEVILFDTNENMLDSTGAYGNGFMMQPTLTAGALYVLAVMGYDTFEIGMTAGDLTLDPTGVSLVFPHTHAKQQGDELWVPVGSYLYYETFFEGGYGTAPETCTVVSGDETVACLEFEASNMGELYCGNVGTTTITATTESDLSHTYILHVVEELYGDVTQDGVIDIADAVLMFRYANGRASATVDEAVSFDINTDNRIDIADAVLMFRYVNGRVTTLG